MTVLEQQSRQRHQAKRCSDMEWRAIYRETNQVLPFFELTRIGRMYSPADTSISNKREERDPFFDAGLSGAFFKLVEQKILYAHRQKRELIVWVHWPFTPTFAF